MANRHGLTAGVVNLQARGHMSIECSGEFVFNTPDIMPSIRSRPSEHTDTLEFSSNCKAAAPGLLFADALAGHNL